MTHINSSKSVLLLCAALCFSFSLAPQAATVVTVTTQNNNAVNQALKGIRNKLPQFVPNTSVVAIDDTSANQLPELVLTLGSKAVKVARERFSNVPILACLILDEEILDAYANVSGIVMQHSIEKQLLWHQRVLPNVKNIGILYSPKNSQQRLDLFAKAAEHIGLHIVKVPVNTALDLPSALKAIKRNAESILAIPDPIVYSGKTAKGVLLFSFRNKIPLAGLSRAWVKAGALYALDWDYQQLGEQCAAEAAKLLAGQKTQKFKIATSEINPYIINLRTAKSMQLTIDPFLIDGASYVFE